LEEQEGGLRYAVAFDPQIARESRQSRQQRLQKAQGFIESVLHRLGARGRGRPLTPQGAFEQIHDYLRDRKLLRYFRLELTAKGLTVTADEEARRFENLTDGKLIVQTSCGELGAEELILRCKELADIEQAFRTLKSSLQIRPVYHWTPRRIRAHVFLCVLALQVHRFMRTKLARSGLSVERSLERLKTVKAGTLRVQAQQVPYLTALTETPRSFTNNLSYPYPRSRTSPRGLCSTKISRPLGLTPLICQFLLSSSVKVRRPGTWSPWADSRREISEHGGRGGLYTISFRCPAMSNSCRPWAACLERTLRLG